MAETYDGCIQRSGRQKTAGVTLYLMEELGDARLRCDQLVRYLDQAVKLIEKSSHKDHFFEVAGHLITSIPDVAFRLQKSLQAVALAADRLDYEEIKQELRPEKVDELENVLREVRIRQVQHRSEIPMKPKQVAARIREMAKLTREEGLPLLEMAKLIRDLDPGRTASSDTTAANLDRIAEVLESPEGSVGRRELATVLARLSMEAELNTALRQASKPRLTQEMMQLADVGEVKKKFKEQNPDISDSELNEIADQWQKNKDVVKDKTALYMSPLLTAFDDIRTMALQANRMAEGGYWRKALMSLYSIVDEIGTVLVHLGETDTQKSEALKRQIRQAVPLAQHMPRQPEFGEGQDVSVSVEDAPYSNELVASAADDAKRSRFEEGKPADPTENMDPADASKWKKEHDKHKDNFKAASVDDLAWKA